MFVGHLGGAVGGTTALLISLPVRPSEESSMPSLESGRRPLFDTNTCASGLPPIAVVILANLEHASGIGTLAIQLVELLTAELVDYSSKNSELFQL
ncbi:unnamed protein product [Dibothriocephalus latus]|uniref:Uncharacterized protein n=1 Tax=Dibothriocephalus latus TaxID=60516 RepID=A0A3P7N0N5_DIBLA|nr:unnamed protein product [Dibothriocephalus latus]